MYKEWVWVGYRNRYVRRMGNKYTILCSLASAESQLLIQEMTPTYY